MLPDMKWYPREPNKFLLVVQGLGPELIGAYAVLIEQMHVRGGHAPRDDRHLAGVLGCSLRKSRGLTDRLIELGKISVDGEMLTESTVLQITENQRINSVQRSKAGRKGAENRWRSNKNNNLDMAEPSHSAMQEEKREDKTIGGGDPQVSRSVNQCTEWTDDARCETGEIGAELHSGDLSEIFLAVGHAISRTSEHWTDAALRHHVEHWKQETNLTTTEIANVMRDAVPDDRSNLIQSPRYFDSAVKRVAELAARNSLNDSVAIGSKPSKHKEHATETTNPNRIEFVANYLRSVKGAESG